MSVVTETLKGALSATTDGSSQVALTNQTISAGDLAVFRFVWDPGTQTISTVTDGAGNTWAVAVQKTNAIHCCAGIAYSVLTSALSAATITVTFTAASIGVGGQLASFNSDTGWVVQATVLDQVASQQFSGTAWTSTATAATTQADELLVGVATSSTGGGGNASTPDAGWTEESDTTPAAPNDDLVTQWQHVTATGAYAASGTWVTSRAGPCCIATFLTGTGVATAATTFPATPVPFMSNRRI